MGSSSNQLFNFGSENNDSNGLFGGSNQYGSYPTLNMGTNGLAGGNTPGAPQTPGIPQNQPSTSAGPISTKIGSGGTSGPGGAYQGTGPTTTGTGTGQYQVGTPQDPALTSQFLSWLQSNIGQGAPAFNESSALPSGGTTAPGSLSAPANPTLQSLMALLQSPNNPMNKMSNTGNPTDVGPAWQAMLGSEQQNIQKNQAQLKEGMNLSGNLAGSPMGTAMSDYETQVTKNQNAQLTQAQQTAQEAASGRMLTAGGTQEEMQQKMSQYIQGLDQESIDRLYKEFIRTSPDYNPLIQNEQAGAAQYPPYLHTKDTMDQILEGTQAAKNGASTLVSLFGGG